MCGDVGPDPRGPAQPDHRIEVRAVHVHLPAVLVDDVADVDDALSNTPWVEG